MQECAQKRKASKQVSQEVSLFFLFCIKKHLPLAAHIQYSNGLCQGSALVSWWCYIASVKDTLYSAAFRWANPPSSPFSIGCSIRAGSRRSHVS